MMLFKKYHVLPMYLGIKTYTRRFWKYPRKVGSFHKCQTDFRSAPFGALEILEVYQQPLDMMDEWDACREGGYTLEEYKKTLEMITKKKWDPAATPYVVRFKFTPMEELNDEGLIWEYTRLWREHMEEINGIRHEVSLFQLW